MTRRSVAWFALPVEAIYATLRSSPAGLTSAEVARRLAEYGPNELRAEAKESLLGVFLKQFTSFLILLLLGAGIVSFVLGEALDGIVILAIVFLSGLLGFFQEYRASKALAALQRMAAPVATAVATASRSACRLATSSPATSSFSPPATGSPPTCVSSRRTT